MPKCSDLFPPGRMAADRKQAHLNKTQLAALIGVSPRTVVRWEASGGAMSARNMYNFIEATGSTVRKLPPNWRPGPAAVKRAEGLASSVSASAGGIERDSTLAETPLTGVDEVMRATLSRADIHLLRLEARVNALLARVVVLEGNQSTQLIGEYI